MKLLEIYYKNCGAEKTEEQKPLMDKPGFIKAVEEYDTEIKKKITEAVLNLLFIKETDPALIQFTIEKTKL